MQTEGRRQLLRSEAGGSGKIIKEKKSANRGGKTKQKKSKEKKIFFVIHNFPPVHEEGGGGKIAENFSHLTRERHVSTDFLGVVTLIVTSALCPFPPSPSLATRICLKLKILLLTQIANPGFTS